MVVNFLRKLSFIAGSLPLSLFIPRAVSKVVRVDVVERDANFFVADQVLARAVLALSSRDNIGYYILSLRTLSLGNRYGFTQHFFRALKSKLSENFISPITPRLKEVFSEWEGDVGFFLQLI